MPGDACKTEILGSKISAALSYAISGGLVVGERALEFMNTNAAACGVMLGILTFMTNFYFQKKASSCQYGPGVCFNPDYHPGRRRSDVDEDPALENLEELEPHHLRVHHSHDGEDHY